MNIKIESTATIKQGDMSIDEKYEPAMKIRSKKKAAAYLKLLVAHTMLHYNLSREEALETEKRNLAYYSGYFNGEIQERVRRLFDTPMGR